MKMKSFHYIKASACIMTICAILCAVLIISNPNKSPSVPTIIEETKPITVIIDAGHGGEDGGTQSADGTLEKDLNLDIALRLCELLKKQGVNVILTRESDTLLYDRNTDYKGRKKLLDAEARLKIANDNPDAIFVSIHQNAFSSPQYSGLQVWYSGNNASSLPLAEAIQLSVKTTLQPENNRAVKLSGSNVYIMQHIKNPAVLIECGFLSNPTEAKKLSDPSYRQNLSQVICDAIIGYLINVASS